MQNPRHLCETPSLGLKGIVSVISIKLQLEEYTYNRPRRTLEVTSSAHLVCGQDEFCKKKLGFILVLFVARVFNHDLD